MKKKHKVRRQKSALDSFMLMSALQAAARNRGGNEFPLASLCAAIISQVEHDWQSHASSYDSVGLMNLEREILYPDGVVTNILETCHCAPEKFIQKLRKDYPIGCETPKRKRSAKQYDEL